MGISWNQLLASDVQQPLNILMLGHCASNIDFRQLLIGNTSGKSPPHFERVRARTFTVL